PGSNPGSLANANGTLFFAANDGTSGNELWTSDGSDAGTSLVTRIHVGNLGSSISSPTEVNGTMFFSADDGSTGNELFRSDGTGGGTVLVKDINPNFGYGPAGSNPSSLTNVNGTPFFPANDGVNGTELWMSDGSGAGTVMVKDINSGSGGSYPDNLTVVNGILFFTADDGVNGRELWQSDGTDAGTFLVLDINPGGYSSSPS